MTRSQTRARMRMAWGWCLPCRRASACSLAAQGEACRELSARACSAVRARRLAAQRNPTVRVLPDARVPGAAPHSPIACSTVVARSRIGPTSAMIWARLTSPMRAWAAAAWPWRGRAALARARSRSAMVTSRVRSRRTWARTSSASVSGARPKWWGWGLAEPGEQLGGAAATAVGVSAVEGREAGFAEPGGGLWGAVAEALRSLATLHMRFAFQESDFVEPLLRSRTVAREGEPRYLPRRYDPKAAALEAWHKNKMPSAHQDVSRFRWEARRSGHLAAEVYASELPGDLYVATATPDTFVAHIGAGGRALHQRRRGQEGQGAGGRGRRARGGVRRHRGVGQPGPLGAGGRAGRGRRPGRRGTGSATRADAPGGGGRHGRDAAKQVRFAGRPGSARNLRAAHRPRPRPGEPGGQRPAPWAVSSLPGAFGPAGTDRPSAAAMHRAGRRHWLQDRAHALLRNRPDRAAAARTASTRRPRGSQRHPGAPHG